jgi:hypothetical protein
MQDKDANSENRIAGAPRSALRPVWLAVRERLPSTSVDLGLVALGAHGIFIAACLWAGAANRPLPNFAPNLLIGVAFFSSTFGLLAAGVSSPSSGRQRGHHKAGVILCTLGLFLCVYPVGFVFAPG